MTMQRIVAVGECMIELSDRRGADWRMGFAGDTLNTLWYLRALLPDGAVTDYFTAFGDDPFSREQMDFLSGHGIGTAGSPVIAGKAPGLYAVNLDPAGERSFTYWRSDSAARRLADDPEALATSLAAAGLVYFSGITLAILDNEARTTLLTALQDVRKETAIAFDPNHRPPLWPDGETARAAYAWAYETATIVLPTFDDEQGLFGDADAHATAARVTALGPGEVIVKQGAGPAIVSIDGKASEIAAREDVRPVDTSGAGDSFNGAYLAARMTGWEPEDSVRFAHAIAALVVTHHGALLPMEGLAPFRQMLEKR